MPNVAPIIFIIALFATSVWTGQSGSAFSLVTNITINNTVLAGARTVSNEQYIAVLYVTDNDPSVTSISVYSLESQTWQLLPYQRMPSLDRSIAVLIRDTIVTIGSSTNDVHSVAHIYSFSKQEWIESSMRLLPLHDVGSFIYNGNIYLVGGYAYGHPTEYIQILSPEEDTFTYAEATLTQRRGEVSVTRYDNLALFAGGRINEYEPEPRYSTLVEIYNLTSDAIERSYNANLGPVDGRLTIATANNQIFVAFENLVDIYDIATRLQTIKQLQHKSLGVASLLDRYPVFFSLLSNGTLFLSIHDTLTKNWTTSTYDSPNVTTDSPLVTSSSQNYAFILLAPHIITLKKPCTSDEDCNIGSKNMCIPNTRCIVETGTCVNNFASKGTSCDDGIWCNGADLCDGYGECIHLGSPCPKNQECNNTCNENDRNCFRPINAACSKDACDGKGLCSALPSKIVTDLSDSEDPMTTMKETSGECSIYCVSILGVIGAAILSTYMMCVQNVRY